MPANRAGLYSMTATLGTVPTDGLFTLSRSFDGLGGMAKTVEDLEMLMNLLLSDQAREAQSRKWEDISIGFVDPIVWNAFGFQNFPDEGVEKQIVSIAYESTYHFSNSSKHISWTDMNGREPK